MKIGDQVSVIDDDLAGVITSINGKQISFKDEFGFIHKFSKEKLLKKDYQLYQGIYTPNIKSTINQSTFKYQGNFIKLDLHFHEMVRNPKKYSSFERMMIQKEKMLETIEFCKKNKIKKLEIIHGIGDGVLQKLVIEILEEIVGLEFQHQEILPEQSGSVLVFIS